MKTLKSLPKLLLTIVATAVLFTSCDNIDLTTICYPSEVAGRSCNVVSQSWINELKTLAAEEFSSSPSELEVSAIEKLTDTSYAYYTQSTLAGRPVNDITKFLILVTKDGYEGNIVGYHDPTSLSFCATPNVSFLHQGEVENVVYTTLGIIGVDADSW